jgi:hypothetical protein
MFGLDGDVHVVIMRRAAVGPPSSHRDHVPFKMRFNESAAGIWHPVAIMRDVDALLAIDRGGSSREGGRIDGPVNCKKYCRNKQGETWNRHICSFVEEMDRPDSVIISRSLLLMIGNNAA